jgi:ubiquinone biosynthesis protein UbiJ
MGRGGGGGFGRGWRHRFNAAGLRARQSAAETASTAALGQSVTVVREHEIATLKGQAESLRVNLDQMQKRIAELEAEAKPE